MTRVPEIIPISDLRQGAAALIQKVRGSREPVVVTQRGRAAAVLLSVDEYERREAAFEILNLLVRAKKRSRLEPATTWMRSWPTSTRS